VLTVSTYDVVADDVGINHLDGRLYSTLISVSPCLQRLKPYSFISFCLFPVSCFLVVQIFFYFDYLTSKIKMVTITKTLVAAIAVTSVSALPQASSTLATMATSSSAIVTPLAAAASPDPEVQAALFRDLFSAPTAIKRFQRLLTAKGQELLSGDALRNLIVFNFNGATPAKGALGGATKAAVSFFSSESLAHDADSLKQNIETFPILTGLGISTTLGFLSACGINTPHVHPRATEFLTVVEGDIDFGYILENGLVAAGQNAEVAGSLSKFQGTVFPMGSIHYQINNKCQPATFVATLNNEDPGTSQVAQNFFGLNPDVVNATLGFPKTINGTNIEEFRKYLPVNIAQSVDICLKQCGYQGSPTGYSAGSPSATHTGY
jgi:hypothetical protein